MASDPCIRYTRPKASPIRSKYAPHRDFGPFAIIAITVNLYAGIPEPHLHKGRWRYIGTKPENRGGA